LRHVDHEVAHALVGVDDVDVVDAGGIALVAAVDGLNLGIAQIVAQAVEAVFDVVGVVAPQKGAMMQVFLPTFPSKRLSSLCWPSSSEGRSWLKS
jgi:hypothetical protein